MATKKAIGGTAACLTGFSVSAGAGRVGAGKNAGLAGTPDTDERAGSPDRDEGKSGSNLKGVLPKGFVRRH